MLAEVFAATLAAQAPALPTPTSGEWVLIAVQRVIAPENMPGQCFVQARVDQVVRGKAYQAGQPVYISLACRHTSMLPAAAPARGVGAGVRTVDALVQMRRVLVRLDLGGRVVDNQYYAVGPQPLR